MNISENIMAVICLFLLMIISGCSWIIPAAEGPEEVSLPECSMTGDLLRDTAWLSKEIRALSIRGRLKVSTPGEDSPWIRSEIFWKRGYSLGAGMRITGKAVLGINVFDCLMLPEQIFLYIPSHNRLYYAGGMDSWHGYSVEDVNTLLSLALDPWLAAIMQDAELFQGAGRLSPSRHREIAEDVFFCIRFRTRRGYGFARFRKKDFAPLEVELPSVLLSFSEHLSRSDDRYACLPFPEKISMVFRDYDLKITIKTLSLKVNIPLDDTVILDPSPFSIYTFQPLEFLLDSIRYKKAE